MSQIKDLWIRTEQARAEGEGMDLLRSGERQRPNEAHVDHNIVAAQNSVQKVRSVKVRFPKVRSPKVRSLKVHSLEVEERMRDWAQNIKQSEGNPLNNASGACETDKPEGTRDVEKFLKEQQDRLWRNE